LRLPSADVQLSLAAAAPAAGGSTSSGSSFPVHDILKMPALSPTMSMGNIISWNKKVRRGAEFNKGSSSAAADGFFACDAQGVQTLLVQQAF
jgi:hypothetical protein